MKNGYMTGIVLSALFHAPLLKEKEYLSFAAASLLWPVPAFCMAAYIRYLMWGNYQHSRMVELLTGPYAEVFLSYDEEHQTRSA
jgi:hypothetical protein